MASLVAPIWLIARVQDRNVKLLLLIMSLTPIFIFLTISYETLFYLAFALTLVAWFDLDSAPTAPTDQQSDVPTSTLGLSDLRRAIFLLTFVHVGFFGTGNVASISSFYLEPVYRLVPVFNPFLMASLLMFKIMIPFMILASVATAMNDRLKHPPFALFLLALCISDVLTINFFFLVKDQGSWLEIGQTISHFAIANLLLVFLGFLNLVGAWLMRR